ncbi:hypothetical protein HNP29_005281 [Pseudomonas alcaligenes]|nr:hypothetical protein [Pseudomonas alcaligenes]
MENPVKILIPCGSIGSGIREEEVRLGIALGAQAIACDAGSTDSGAAYMIQGVGKYPRATIKQELAILMKARAEAKIPLIIGSCGQSGTDAALDWMRDIALEIARENGLTPKIAVLYCEQDKATLKAKHAVGKIRELPPLGPITDELIDSCERIVASMGVEPYIAALRDGADIVLGGRTTDTAVIASYALFKGAPAGPAWHAAKIAECGAQCTVDPTNGNGILISIDSEGFEVEPLQPNNSCAPETVCAHMLYENSNPFLLTEPGGVLDVTDARYVQKDARVVRVTGARWIEKPYTMKLEGAAAGRYQTLMLIGIEDPDILARIDEFQGRMHEALTGRVQSVIGAEAGDFHISLRVYGWNAVSGMQRAPGTPAPLEVGILFVATADTQAMATRIAKTCNPWFFHWPLERNRELPSHGFPFSPAELERGAVYEFKLNHVVETDDGFELVRSQWIDLSNQVEPA